MKRPVPTPAEAAERLERIRARIRTAEILNAVDDAAWRRAYVDDVRWLALLAELFRSELASLVAQIEAKTGSEFGAAK